MQSLLFLFYREFSFIALCSTCQVYSSLFSFLIGDAKLIVELRNFFIVCRAEAATGIQ